MYVKVADLRGLDNINGDKDIVSSIEHYFFTKDTV